MQLVDYFKSRERGTHYDLGNGVKLPLFDGNIEVHYINFESIVQDTLGPLLPDNIDYNYPGEGPYEFRDVHIHPDDIVFDVGANMGLFSLYAAVQGAIVHSFEPAPAPYRYLKQLLALNQGLSITAHNMALSDKVALTKLYYLDWYHAASTLHKEVLDDPENYTEATVSALTIDTFLDVAGLPTVNFIKMDTEGSECNILKGAGETLARYKPKLAIAAYHRKDDPVAIVRIIKAANPKYNTVYANNKIYAW